MNTWPEHIRQFFSLSIHRTGVSTKSTPSTKPGSSTVALIYMLSTITKISPIHEMLHQEKFSPEANRITQLKLLGKLLYKSTLRKDQQAFSYLM